MFVVDKRVTHLAQGYDRILDAQRDLLARWRHRLLAAYAHQRAIYDAARAQSRARTRRLATGSIAAVIVASALFAAGFFLAGMPGWPAAAAMLAGLAIGAAAAATLLWRVVLSTPQPPAHPLRAPLRTRLFPPLLPRWCEGLQGRLPEEMPYEGAKGEYDFVAEMVRLPGVPGYLVYRLRQRPGDDVDVVAVGPWGVWVFEVKYWSGRITWRPGGWHREKSYYAPGGHPVTENKEISQPPDEQWQRMSDDVAETLRRRVGRLLVSVPGLMAIGGGLAFTHPEATYDIAPGCPCAWATIGGWKQQLARAPSIPGLTERAQLQILDALLARHREIGGTGETLSMEAYAAQWIRHVENNLAAWLRESERGPR
jgi:hypothetical protein